HEPAFEFPWRRIRDLCAIEPYMWGADQRFCRSPPYQQRSLLAIIRTGCDTGAESIGCECPNRLLACQDSRTALGNTPQSAFMASSSAGLATPVPVGQPRLA